MGNAAPAQEWYGIYFHAGKIGYASSLKRRLQVNGHLVLQVDTQTFMQIKLLGAEVTTQLDQIDTFRPDGAPLTTDFINRSNGHVNRVLATYTARAVNCVVSQGADKTRRSVAIPAGVVLKYQDDFTLGPVHLKPGATWSEYYFDPATLSVERATETVQGLEPTMVAGKSQKLWHVEGQSPVGSIQMLADSGGGVVRLQMPLGISIVRETRETARAAADYHPTEDMAEAASVASDVPISRPRDVAGLALLLSGAPASAAIPSGPGQESRKLPSGEWKLTITRTSVPSSPASIPVKGWPVELESTPELTASSPEMAVLAKSILTGERNAAKAVALLHDWVNVHMRARYDIGVIRSGLDILHEPAGVCRDYAVLYTSLARAAGIPTRVCSGLVGWKGRFYYHAWAESFVGGWVRVDATLPGEAVDATHITLARGDARSMYRAANLIGRLKMHVIKISRLSKAAGENSRMPPNVEAVPIPGSPVKE